MAGLRPSKAKLGLGALFEAAFAKADHLTEQGRSQARHRAIALTALTSAFARFVGIATTLVAVPLTLHYLGAERYGMWMTLSAFALLLAFTDFGIGNSVLTAVARGAGSEDSSDLRRQIASAYGATWAIALIMLAALAATYSLVPWSRLYNVSSPVAVGEAGPSTGIFLAIVFLSTPLSLIYRIQLGLQQGYRSSLWQTAASLTALMALVLAIRSETSLPWLVLALAGAPMMLALVNGLDFFVRVRPDLRPRLSDCDRRTMRLLIGNGALFVVLQLCAALLFQTNALIIAQVLDATAVAVYAVPERMFSVVTVILALVLTPLWPAYGEAAARGDREWVRRTLKRSLVLSVGTAAVLSALLVILGPTLLRWWVGNAVAVPFTLILGLGIWKVIEAAGNALAMFLNGLNRLRVQALAAVVTVVASILLKIWWIDLFGLPGVMLATIVAYGVFAMPVLCIVASQALSGAARPHGSWARS
jgi:O-antigen/teichoic acid export membrane protein